MFMHDHDWPAPTNGQFPCKLMDNAQIEIVKPCKFLNDMDTQNRPFQQLLQTDKSLFFFFICLGTLSLLIIKKNFIESEIAAFEILEGRGQNQGFHLTNLIQYLTIPIIYLWKFTLIGFIIWVGCFMFGQKMSFGNAWQVAMVSESVFFLAELMKIGWFFWVETDPTIWQVREFYPFSLINFFDAETLDGRWLYPLKALNIFEIAYWYLLAQGLIHFSPKLKSSALLIVACSYSICFSLWLAFYLIVYN